MEDLAEDLSDCPDEERLKKLGLLSQERSRLRAVLPVCINTRWDGVKTIGPDSSWRYPMNQQEVMGTH